MRIEFKQISIKNFKGVLAERTIKFNPTLTQILGANHAGKTTIVDAVRWVLFDKNSDGQSVFGIDPKDENGEVIHHLDNTVALELTADGTDYRLEKVRSETWSKPRQKEEEELTGHTTKYFVNDNKYTQKDYKEFVDSLCKESLFKVLTMPSYFPSLPADEQRNLLTMMVGKTTDEDIAGNNEDFKGLLQELAGTDLQKFREQLKYRIGELKKEIETLPSRISENADEQTFRVGRKGGFTRAGEAEEDGGVLAVHIGIGRAVHRSDALQREVVVHHGEHTFFHLAAVPCVHNKLLTSCDVEDNSCLGIQSQFFIVVNLCFGCIVNNEVRFEVFQFFCRRFNEHVFYEMCLPCYFHDETDGHAGIFVCPTESIYNVKFLIGKFFYGNVFYCCKSLR